MIVFPAMVAVLDDDPDMLDSLEELIPELGFPVKTFAAYTEAREFIRKLEESFDKQGFYKQLHLSGDQQQMILQELQNSDEILIGVVCVDQNLINTTGLKWLSEENMKAGRLLFSGSLSDTEALGAFNDKKVDYFLRKGSSQFSKKLEFGLLELNFEFFHKYFGKSDREPIINTLKALYHKRLYDSLFPIGDLPVYKVSTSEGEGILHVFDKEEKDFQLNYARESGASAAVVDLLSKPDRFFCEAPDSKIADLDPSQWQTDHIKTLTPCTEEGTFYSLSLN